MLMASLQKLAKAIAPTIFKTSDRPCCVSPMGEATIASPEAKETARVELSFGPTGTPTGRRYCGGEETARRLQDLDWTLRQEMYYSLVARRLGDVECFLLVLNNVV